MGLIPKPFKQSTHFDDLLIPKEHLQKQRNFNSDFWNRLYSINSAYPNCTIFIDYHLVFFNDGCYGIDMKVKSRKKEIQVYLNDAYKKWYHLSHFPIPKENNDYFLKMKQG